MRTDGALFRNKFYVDWCIQSTFVDKKNKFNWFFLNSTASGKEKKSKAGASANFPLSNDIKIVCELKRLNVEKVHRSKEWQTKQKEQT